MNVSMEQHQCFVCGCHYDTGNILMAKRLSTKLKDRTITGVGLCPEHQKMKDDGYIALIEATDSQGTQRTGNVAHIRESVWEQVFDVPVPPQKICFVEVGVVDLLKSKAA